VVAEITLLNGVVVRYFRKIPISRIFFVIVLLITANGNSAESITFQSTSEEDTEKTLLIDGLLTVPDEMGPHPSVILLHGGSGLITDSYQPWVDRLKSWGYIVLQVDSFSCRGFSMKNRYGGTPYSQLIRTRSQDALDAERYLRSLRIVDIKKIAIIGWSQGGAVVNYLVGSTSLSSGFKAAVSFYPLCNTMIDDIYTPLLVMVGEKDNVTHAYLCKSMLPLEGASNELTFKVLQNAHHAFDIENADAEFSWGSRHGFKYLYNPEAASNAISMVNEFLKKHLNP
jgi:dienelactone hydrolase